MSEQLHRVRMERPAWAAAIAAGSLLLAGCATNAPVEAAAPATQITRDYEYQPDGTRVITVRNENGNLVAQLYEFCEADGTLASVALPTKFGGNTIERTPNHPDCADGILDEADAVQ